MRRFSLPALGTLLGLLLLLAGGCGRSSDLPPGGRAAVAHWQAVLKQYPDLPSKVRAIVKHRGRGDWGQDLPQTEIRVYGQDEVVAVTGSQVDLLVTDLDDAALRKLLAIWESVPRWAAALNLEATLPFTLPESTRHVVVLGREGRIEISGPGEQNSQSINILADDTVGRTTIGVHAFGPAGEAALSHLAGQYNQVRGPPRSDVRAGRIALPPPEDNVTVLVIGKLATLDIAGPTDDARQQISFASYLNQHQTQQVSGVPAGTPIVGEPTYVAEALGPGPDPAAAPYKAPVSSTPSGSSAPISAVPTYTPPLTLPGNGNFQPPIQLPQNNFRPPVIVTPPPPPPVYRPPVVPRFR